jgi:hypothetical protein
MLKVYVPRAINAKKIDVFLRHFTGGSGSGSSLENIVGSLPVQDTCIPWKKTSHPADVNLWAVDTFDVLDDKPAQLLPIDEYEPWETIDMNIASFSPNFVLSILPTILQLEYRLRYTTHRNKTTLCPFPLASSEVAAAVISALDVNAVLLLHRHGSDFEKVCKEARAPNPAYYQIILAPNEQPTWAPENPLGIYEVHIVPGIIGLFQWEYLAREKKMGFHPSERFIWDVEDGNLSVTEPSVTPRFLRTQVLSDISSQDTVCPCGRNMTIHYEIN